MKLRNFKMFQHLNFIEYYQDRTDLECLSEKVKTEEMRNVQSQNQLSQLVSEVI